MTADHRIAVHRFRLLGSPLSLLTRFSGAIQAGLRVAKLLLDREIVPILLASIGREPEQTSLCSRAVLGFRERSCRSVRGEGADLLFQDRQPFGPQEPLVNVQAVIGTIEGRACLERFGHCCWSFVCCAVSACDVGSL
jgi:hypothetical protein